MSDACTFLPSCALDLVYNRTGVRFEKLPALSLRDDGRGPTLQYENELRQGLAGFEQS